MGRRAGRGMRMWEWRGLGDGAEVGGRGAGLGTGGREGGRWEG